MGLDKTKRILTRDDFNIDPLYAQNAQLSVESRQTLPSLQNDVTLDKFQSTFYSVQNILQRLLLNDQFIELQLKKSTSMLSGISKARLSAAVDQTEVNADSISSIYSNALSSHLAAYHGSDDVLPAVASTFLKADASNFDLSGARSSFQQYNGQLSSSAMSLSNDFATFVEFSDQVDRPTNYVAAAVCNKLTGGKFKASLEVSTGPMAQMPSLAQTSYIYKEWMSGLKELYVHLPTTYTMYNENLSASQQDYWKGENVKDNITVIQLTINRRHFLLNHIYQAIICGQSLPLQIHNDSGYEYFADTIQPSMLKTLCVPTSGDESTNLRCILDETKQTYTIYFTCYGTDEQAIKIFGD